MTVICSFSEFEIGSIIQGLHDGESKYREDIKAMVLAPATREQYESCMLDTYWIASDKLGARPYYYIASVD